MYLGDRCHWEGIDSLTTISRSQGYAKPNWISTSVILGLLKFDDGF